MQECVEQKAKRIFVFVKVYIFYSFFAAKND